MAALTLHMHPLSSYCQKVCIALDELGVQAEHQALQLGDPAQRAAFMALWPTGKMPVLVDQGRAIGESSIIIEHVQRHHAARGVVLIPDGPNDMDQALQVRLWDRLFDLYVMAPMQALTFDLMRPEVERDARAAARSHDGLLAAYGWIERHLAGLEGCAWAAGSAFSLADCAAAPSLFYAVTYLPLQPQHTRLAAYFERLVARPSVARAIDAARPYFKFYPGRQGLARRFFDPDSV